MLEHDLIAARAWCAKHRLKAFFLPARPSDQGGMASGGVAIVVRDWLSLTTVAGLAAKVGFTGAGLVVVASVYLEASSGLGDSNLSSLATLAAAIQVDNLPFVALVDYNMSPAKVATATFAQKLGATILAPEGGGGTCRAKAGSWSTINFGILSRALAWGTRSVTECAECTANRHIPVQIRFYAAFADTGAHWTVTPALGFL